MNRLVLLRHGRTEGTERHLYYGATDLPLLEDGVRELKDAARRGVYPAPGGFSFVTTGMRRTDQTLRAIYGDVPFSVLENLREVNFGIFEMKSYEEVKSEPSYQAWLAGDWCRRRFPTHRRRASRSAPRRHGLRAGWSSFSRAKRTRSASATAAPFSPRCSACFPKKEKTAMPGSRSPASGIRSIW